MSRRAGECFFGVHFSSPAAHFPPSAPPVSRNRIAPLVVALRNGPVGDIDDQEEADVNKKRVALWAVRSPRARRLAVKGLKNRRVRGLAWAVMKRRVTG